jgi:hypothetical protein
MTLTGQIAKLFRDFYNGGNWTGVNLKDGLEGVSWQEATTKVYSFNTIADLLYHIDHYVRIVVKVLTDQPLNVSDENSFAHPPVLSEQDWKETLIMAWSNAEKFAMLVEDMPENKLWETFLEEKYGNYYTNIHGVIEHGHYHLGQIILIKKILLQQA